MNEVCILPSCRVERTAQYSRCLYAGYCGADPRSSTGTSTSQLLLERGADVNAKTNDDVTLLSFAVEDNHTQLAAYLRTVGGTGHRTLSVRRDDVGLKRHHTTPHVHVPSGTTRVRHPFTRLCAGK